MATGFFAFQMRENFSPEKTFDTNSYLAQSIVKNEKVRCNCAGFQHNSVMRICEQIGINYSFEINLLLHEVGFAITLWTHSKRFISDA